MALSKVQEIFKDGEIKVEEIPSLQAAISSLLEKYPNGSEELREAKKILEKALGEEGVIVNQKTRSDIQGLAKNINSRLNEENEVIEGPFEYGLNGIKNNSEIFKLFLGSPGMKQILREYLQSKFEKIEYLPKGIDTNGLELVAWKTVIENISITAGIGYSGSLFKDYIASKVESFKEFTVSLKESGSEVLNNVDTGNGEGSSIDKIGSLIDGIQDISDIFKNGSENLNEAETKKVTSVVTQLGEYVDYTLNNYFANLSALGELAKQNNAVSETGVPISEYKGLFLNPIVLSEILSSGKTEITPFNISLGKGIFELGSETPQDQAAAQQEFMLGVSTLTSKNGKKIDNLRENVKGIAGLLVKLGFDSESLSSFQESLKSFLPPVGTFLASIMAFFINGAVESEIDKLTTGKKIKTSLKNFDLIFNGENETRVPFIKDETGEISKEQTGILKGFLEEFQAQETLANPDEKGTLIDDENFWTNLFSKNSDGKNEPTMKDAISKITPLIPESKISQEDFFEKLEKINFEKIEKDEENSEAGDEITEEKQESNEDTGVVEEAKENSVVGEDDTADIDKDVGEPGEIDASAIPVPVIVGAVGVGAAVTTTAGTEKINTDDLKTSSESKSALHIGDDSIPPGTRFQKPDIIEVGERSIPSYMEQINEIQGLPATLLHPQNGEEIRISEFNADSSSINIGGEKFKIKLKSGTWGINISEINVKNGILSVTYKAKFSSEKTTEIKGNAATIMLLALINEGKYNLDGNTESDGSGKSYKLSIEKI